MIDTVPPVFALLLPASILMRPPAPTEPRLVISEMLPPTPDFASCEEIIIEPLLPLDDVPVLMKREPDVPAAGFEVARVNVPLLVEVPKPLENDSEPPVESALSPVPTTSCPAPEDVPAPTMILMLPTPDVRSIDPLLPLLALPDLRDRLPLTPLSKGEMVCTVKAPLVEAAPNPVEIEKAPPVSLVLSPLEMTTLPAELVPFPG